MQLYEWQSDCLNLWARNGYRGIVKAVTGSGKTFLALSAVRRLESESDQELCVKIVVPQTFLGSQWREEIKRVLGVKTRDIGVYSGVRKIYRGNSRFRSGANNTRTYRKLSRATALAPTGNSPPPASAVC